MMRNLTRVALATLTCASLAAGVFAAADPVTRRDAARLQAKLDKITKNGLAKRAAGRTAISEAELNSYLRYELGDRIPPGVKDPWVTILDETGFPAALSSISPSWRRARDLARCSIRGIWWADRCRSR